MHGKQSKVVITAQFDSGEIENSWKYKGKYSAKAWSTVNRGILLAGLKSQISVEHYAYEFCRKPYLHL